MVVTAVNTQNVDNQQFTSLNNINPNEMYKQAEIHMFMQGMEQILHQAEQLAQQNHQELAQALNN